jgi:hypothetical protein
MCRAALRNPLVAFLTEREGDQNRFSGIVGVHLPNRFSASVFMVGWCRINFVLVSNADHNHPKGLVRVAGS